VLPAPARMRRAEDFRRTVRSGVRAARSSVVVHARCSPDNDRTRVGFVVSRSIGSAVTRNTVKRRLRHLAADRLANGEPAIEVGIDVVVRALPPAAHSPVTLRTDFARAWSSAVSRLDCP
jgi:ribonuclease P protein component